MQNFWEMNLPGMQKKYNAYYLREFVDYDDSQKMNISLNMDSFRLNAVENTTFLSHQS